MDRPNDTERLGELRGELHEIERERGALEDQLRTVSEREAKVRREIEEIEHHGKSFVIFIDDQQYHTEQSTMTGAAIKALAGKDASYQLFEEREGGEDQQIADDKSVAIKDDMRFYTVPPATFGR